VEVDVREGVAVAVGVREGVCDGVTVLVAVGENVRVIVGVSDGVALGVYAGSRQTGVESPRAMGSRVPPY